MAKKSLKEMSIPETVEDQTNTPALHDMTPAPVFKVPEPKKRRTEYARIQVICTPEMEADLRALQAYRQSKNGADRYTVSKLMVQLAEDYLRSEAGAAELRAAKKAAARSE